MRLILSAAFAALLAIVGFAAIETARRGALPRLHTEMR